MIYRITHRWTGAVLFSAETETVRLCMELAVMAHADLSSAYLRGADLSGADLSDADLSDADLSDADLSGAYLRGADLSGANLSGANLSGAYLRGADLSGANLSGANLSGADLNGADLRGAYLNGADLRGAYLSDATGITDILSIGPIGSRRDYITATATDDGVRISTGCFVGSLDEFRTAVAETHGDNDHGRHYRAAIALIEARFGAGGA